jgi:hypothetical protein
MYLLKKVETNVVDAATEKPPFGPGFDPKAASQAASMEVWATSMKDEGEYCEFILKDANGAVIGRQTVGGY